MLDIKYVESPLLARIPWLKRESYRPNNPNDIFSDGIWVYVRESGTMPWWGVPAVTCVISPDIPEE